jgi:putative flippase GtrA
MPLQTYRYAACGGCNTLLGLLLYYIGYHYIFNKSIFELGFLVFKPHMAALFLSGTIIFFIGFVLNKYIVFTASNIQGRVQLFRYFLSFSFNIILNYFMLKLLIELLIWEPFFSQIFTTIIIALISYLTQKKFTFKTR